MNFFLRFGNPYTFKDFGLRNCMSKIGRTPITITDGLTVNLEANTVRVKGLKGEAVYPIPAGITAKIEENKVILELANNKDRTKRAVYGLTRANLANVMEGMSKGFEKKLELQGVGYRAQMQGNDLVLSLGFSHPVKFKPAEGVKIAVAENIITVSGTDSAVVGLMAANIRKIKPPEPYKGKGIRYKGEQVKRKVGKAAKAVGTK